MRQTLFLIVACFSASCAEKRELVDMNPFHALADKCTGTGDPVKKTPFCYKGGATVLGMKEDVVVTIQSAEKVGKINQGTLAIDATGISPEHCKSLNYTKVSETDNKISFDQAKAAQCLSGTKAAAVYCSDQDAVQLHIQIPHLPVPDIAVTLAPAPC